MNKVIWLIAIGVVLIMWGCGSRTNIRINGHDYYVPPEGHVTVTPVPTIK